MYGEGKAVATGARIDPTPFLNFPQEVPIPYKGANRDTLL
jgi:hypothetical protein